MTFSPLDSSIYAPLFRVPEIATVFSDEQYVANIFAVEAALARVQERLKIIPIGSGAAITDAANTMQVDFERVQTGIDKAGVPIIALLQQLREKVDPDSASYVHWGATTQDIMDTALVLQLRAGLQHIEAQLAKLVLNLAQMADHHRHTIMVGRTHSQRALPITFGLKVAGWLAPLVRHQQRLEELVPRLCTLQFGGAAGTLASLYPHGVAVVKGLAIELGLTVPLIPWHTQRDTLVELANWLSLLSGSLAKMGQDIILLAQSEVGEVRESADPTRGGSSTMPQKSNPVISEVIIAAARTNASLLSSMHHALIQEHERATHGWQMEWLALPQMFGLTAAAVSKAIFLSQNLVVDRERMRQNVAAANGLMSAEAVSFALADQMPRAAAKKLVSDAVQVMLAQDRHLIDVVQEMTDIVVDWEALRNESNYLGATQEFIDRVLGAAEGAPKRVGI